MCLWTLELQGDRNMARNKARWWQHSQKVTPHLQACFCLTAPLRNIVPPFYFISFTNGKKKKKICPPWIIDEWLTSGCCWWWWHMWCHFWYRGPALSFHQMKTDFWHCGTPISKHQSLQTPPHTHTSQFNWRNTVLLEPRHVSCALLETFLSTFFRFLSICCVKSVFLFGLGLKLSVFFFIDFFH